MTQRGAPGDPAVPLAEALTAWAAGVTLLTLADGRDDIGTTVSAFCPVSTDPPLIAVSLMAGSYPAEVLARLDPFAVTLLASSQRALAGRSSATSGKPGTSNVQPVTSGQSSQRRARSGRAR